MEEILWQPDDKIKESSNISSYIKWLSSVKNINVKDYNDLWEWSVDNIEDFWLTVWQYFRIKHDGEFKRVISSQIMPGARWFEGAKLNYSEVLMDKLSNDIALIFEREDGVRKEVNGYQLKRDVESLAGFLADAGVRVGDRVAAIMPNCPEAITGLLASASIGAIWSSCSADFGVAGILDRFKQIEPKVLLTVDGYYYNGKRIDRTEVAKKVKESIPTIQTVISIPYLQDKKDDECNFIDWDYALDKGKSLTVDTVKVEFNHPLWILYSSGTTGLPKPLVHSHGGIVIEHLKTLSLHNDLREDDRFFWFTSTGWMMWNYLAGGLMLGSEIVLYDGSPSFPSIGRLWELAEKVGITYFGTSAPFISACSKSNLHIISTYNLKNLRGIGSTGSPLSAELFRWIYKNVKEDVWLGSISGGTDLCTAFVGSCPILPVIAGRIQCRYLGASVHSYDEDGRSIKNRVGELVITKPMPSMPIYFWNDPEYKRYKDAYFSVYPGVWRHGDWIEIKDDGSCIIYGRSDATIKRKGVRIGTSEIYRIVEAIPDVIDSLAVEVDKNGESVMALFVVVKDDKKLDDKLIKLIRERISEELSPRYVPDIIVQAPEVPKTLNGKKMEVPIKRLLSGEDISKIVNQGSMMNPSSLTFYLNFAKEIFTQSSR